MNGIQEASRDDLIKQNLEELFNRQSENVERAARALKVISHPARLKILCVLREGEQSVQNLEHYTGIAQATLSQHLTLLKDRGILISRREANFSLYRFANEKMEQLFELIKVIFCD